MASTMRASCRRGFGFVMSGGVPPAATTGAPHERAGRATEATTLARRLRLCLLLVVLVLVAVPYFDTGVSPAVIAVAMLVPFALAVWSPPLAVAVLLETAPLTDPLAAYFVPRPPASATYGGIAWVEPMFLGVAAGIVTRLLWRAGKPRAPMPAARFFVAAILCALGVQLAGYVVQWQGLAFYPLQTLWWSVPIGQLSPEQTLRASLLFLAAPLSLWLVRNAIEGPEDERVVWLAWLGGTFVVTVCGTWMWIHGRGTENGRVMSVLEDVNSYGSYLVLSLFVAWAVLRSERGRAVRFLAAVVLVLTVWMVFMSGSKIAALATLGSVMAAALCAAPKRRRLRVAVVGIVLLGLWAGVVSVAGSYLPQAIATVMQQASDPLYLLRNLREFRWSIWCASARAFLAHPAAGIGPGLLCQHLGDYYRPGDWGYQPLVENAHNYLLQVAAETGLLGVLGFVWLVWAGVRPALTDAGPEGERRRLLAIGALGYCVTLLTGHALLLSRQTVLFWGFLGVLSAPYDAPAPGRVARHSVWVVIPLFLATLWLDPVPRTCQREFEKGETVGWEFGLGFHQNEGVAASSWRWMKDAGELDACNRTDQPLVGDVTFTVQSFVERRELSVYSHGQPLAQISVGPEPTKFTVPEVRLAPGSTALLFIASPGARRVDPVLHNGDQRSVSLAFIGEARVSVRAP